MLTLFDELRDLNSIRYKEARRIQLREQIMQKLKQVPYEKYAALSAHGISEESHHIFHWGSNGMCAIGISNIVYLLKPANEDPQVKFIQAC